MYYLARALMVVAAIAICLSAAPASGGQAKVYMADICGDSVYVADPALMDTWGAIKVGSEPMGLAASSDGRRVFAVVKGEDKVDVIDTGEDRVIGSVKVGDGPRAMAVTPDGKKLLVCNEGDMTVSVIDTAALTESARLRLAGNPTDIKVSPDGKAAYVADSAGIEVIDLRKMNLSLAPGLGNGWARLEISHTGRRLYLYNGDEKEIVVIDASNNKRLASIKAGTGMKMSPDGEELWYTGPDKSLSVYSTDDDKVVAVLPREADKDSCEFEFSADGKKAFVGPDGGKEDTVNIYDVAGKKKVGWFRSPPCGLGGMLYIDAQ